MERLPIFLNLVDRHCLVVGGGVIAERKVRLLLRAGASVSILSPDLCDGLREQLDSGELTHVHAHYRGQFDKSYWLVVAATSDDDLNRQIGADAEQRGILCNVVDDNDASTFILPAIVDRSPVVIAIGTEGNAPVLAQQLKSQIEQWLPRRIGELATQAGRWRSLVKKRFNSMQVRRRFWQSFFAGPIAAHLLAGRQREAEQLMRAQLVGGSDDVVTSAGEAWIVGAGPGDPDLVTLRAQQLLARADVVLYDRLVSQAVLDFARKEAEFVFVGKRAGARTMSQQDINDLLVEQVRAGHRVCRLKGGDPFVFGRGGEEAQALAEAGLPFQIVPGITAAVGGAAYAGIPLTLRGVSGSVTFATARLNGDDGPDWARIIQAGDTLALYMGTGNVAEIRQQLLRHGVSAETPVAFVENATTNAQREFLCTLATMQGVAAREVIASPAIIYVGAAVAAASELAWFAGNSAASRFPATLQDESVSAVSV